MFVDRHGLADELIYPNGTSIYYERVLALDPKAHDFYRVFEAPGVGHCIGKMNLPDTYFTPLFAHSADGSLL